MKRTFICLLAALLAGTAGAAAAQPATTEIAASGTGSIAMAPDVATINASVETNSENASDAIARNNTIYDRVVANLTKQGVARADIALGYYNIRYVPRPSAIPTNSVAEERYGYTVHRNFLVKVRAIGQAGATSDACIAAGATAIDGIDFGLSDPASARAEAIAKAVADARRNADAVARAAGLHVVSIKSIEYGGRPGIEPVMMARVASAGTQLDQSNVNVTVSVSAVFLAQP
jgi:uncharacterized protein YggE